MNDGLNMDASGVDLSGAISKIMEHPELISMVASVLGKDSAQSADTSAPPQQASDTEEAASVSAAPSPPPEILSTLMPIISKLSALGEIGGKSGASGFRHEQLLCALKPYLSHSRCDAIDYMIKISKMSVLLKGLN